MLNIEFYKNDIQKLGTAYFSCINGKIGECDSDKCRKCIIKGKTHDCVYNRLEWLASEYKKPILDVPERNYLSAVIRPFKKDVRFIFKDKKDTVYGHEKIIISILDEKNLSSYIHLPPFKKDKMYKGMELEKQYTLEELGLNDA